MSLKSTTRSSSPARMRSTLPSPSRSAAARMAEPTPGPQISTWGSNSRRRRRTGSRCHCRGPQARRHRRGCRRPGRGTCRHSGRSRRASGRCCRLLNWTDVPKVPSPTPNRTLTYSVGQPSGIAMSRAPSPFRSTITGKTGCGPPTRYSVAGSNVPSPRPSTTEAERALRPPPMSEFAVARSRFPSPSRSAAAMPEAKAATIGTSSGSSNVPSP